MRVTFIPDDLKQRWQVPDSIDILPPHDTNDCQADILIIRADALADSDTEMPPENRIVVDAVDMDTNPVQVRDWYRMGCHDVILQLSERRLGGPETEPVCIQSGFVGQSPEIRKLFQRINHVARTDATVMIRGESGTGKELVARAIHNNSRRKSGPFIAVNCAAIPETLLEDDLFGHLKGAFTDANDNRIGKIQAADGGTLFLDEVGDMPAVLQVKLLRFLQEQEIQPLGSSIPVKVNTRVVTATAANLESLIEKGTFREDLFFRLHVVPLTIPPLRQRGDDIDHLTIHFLSHYANRHDIPCPTLSDGAWNAIRQHRWPGNVRELEHLVERVLIMREGSGPIQAHELQLPVKQGVTG